MKKIWFALSLAVVSIALVSCGSAPSDAVVPQEQYDSLKSQYEALQSDYSSLQTEYDSIKSDLDSANKQVEDLLLMAEEEESKDAPVSVDVLVYDDEYVEIRFIGCELDRDDEQLVFMATNKTDSELTFQSGTMAIDGLSLGYVSGSDSVASQSKGKVRFETEEEFPTMAPSTISGTIKVIDFEITIWGSQSYEVPFTNLDVAQ